MYFTRSNRDRISIIIIHFLWLVNKQWKTYVRINNPSILSLRNQIIQKVYDRIKYVLLSSGVAWWVDAKKPEVTF